MKKFIWGGLAAMIVVAVTGCTGVPRYDLQSDVTVAHIFDRIQCEAFQAARDYPMYRKQKWVGVADVYLQVDDSAGLTPTLSFIEPLATAGTQFAFGVSGTVKRSRQRLYNETVNLDLSKLNGSNCNKLLDTHDLTGDLGIYETLKIAARSIDTEDQIKFVDKEAVGQTLQFVLLKNISGGPTWTLQRFVGGPAAGAERIDTNKLIVSFAPGAIVTTEVKNGVTRRVVRGGGGAGAADSNNTKLLLQSLPAFQIRPF